MFINHDFKFLYVAVPKTGTASTHAFFGYRTGHPEPDEHHMSAQEAVNRHPEIADYFKFAFVRNPWSKLVSVYHDFTMQRGHQYSAKKKMDKPLLHEFNDFEDLCLRLKDSEWRDNVFFRPQSTFVTMDNGEVIDYVGKFEDLDDHFREACEMIGYPIRSALPMYHVGKYNHDYRKHYSSESREAVRQFYQEDLELFDYEF